MKLSSAGTDLRIQKRHAGQIWRSGEYKGCVVKAEFRCANGHSWLATPDSVATYGGCRRCADQATGAKNRLSENEFKDRLKASHGERITLVGPWLGMKTKTEFRCHGGHVWTTRPQGLTTLKNGCPRCNLPAAGRKRRASAAQILQRLKSVHGDDVRLVSPYETARGRGKFSCAFGHSWESPVSNVLRGGGCPVCARHAHKVRLAKPEADARAAIICRHGNRVMLVGGYSKRTSKADFRCDQGHSWRAVVHNVIVGSGCPTCRAGGFDARRPGILYYIRIGSEIGAPLYKIGVTNLSVLERFPSARDRSLINIIRTWEFERGADALAREQEIIREFASARYGGPSILIGGGNTELFTADVLGLDFNNDLEAVALKV